MATNAGEKFQSDALDGLVRHAVELHQCRECNENWNILLPRIHQMADSLAVAEAQQVEQVHCWLRDNGLVAISIESHREWMAYRAANAPVPVERSGE